jgi:hypothetical protein
VRVLLRVLVLVAISLAAAASCSLDVEGEAAPSPDAGVGGTGGNTVECWAGQKWCSGKCYTYDDPQAGCGSTSCEPCSVPNASTTCIDKKCAVEGCLEGYADCDKNEFVPGCEVDIFNNPTNCGGCVDAGAGEDCTAKTDADYFCKNGRCEVDNCNPSVTGKGDCDGDPTNGCETDLTADLDHCGFCTNACVAPHATSQCIAHSAKVGDCIIIGCDPGWEDCNGVYIDGCEINTLTDSGNCGTGKAACGNKCTAPTNGIAFCNNGACDFQCSSPYSKCGNACVNLSNNVQNCGACGNACPQPAGSVAGCSGSACIFTCNSPLTKCDGQCVDTKTNEKYCGSCTNACVAPAGGSVVCSNGSCIPSCPSGQIICNSTCVNPQTNNTHCGGCNSPCSNERTCQSGQCKCPGNKPVECGSTCQPACCPGAACSPPISGLCLSSGICGCALGLTSCAGACVNTSTSLQHCGSCGTVCTNVNGTTQCSSGTCQPTCSPGWANCDGNPNNGCEASLNNTSSCGSCSIQCQSVNGNPTCPAGVCVPNCNSGYADCDGNKPNGCETNTNTNAAHCGGCNSPCPMGATCSNGSCACPVGKKQCNGTGPCVECCGNNECTAPAPMNKCCGGVCGSC